MCEVARLTIYREGSKSIDRKLIKITVEMADNRVDASKKNPYTEQELRWRTAMTVYGDKEDAKKAGQKEPITVVGANEYFSADELWAKPKT